MWASSHRPQDGRAARDLPSGQIFRFDTPGVQLASLPDAQLVARCRGGDEDAWRELVARFSRYVFAICSQAFRLRAEDSEEVFQEVFARTYQHLARLRDDEAIRPWIGQLTRRLCIDHIRSSSREEIVDPDTLPGGVDEAMPSSPRTAARSSTASSPATRATRRSALRSRSPRERSPAASPAAWHG